MKDKKILILGVVITVILLFTVGITYAFYSYNRTGTNNSQLVVGDIYMHFNESNINKAFTPNNTFDDISPVINVSVISINVSKSNQLNINKLTTTANNNTIYE